MGASAAPSGQNRARASEGNVGDSATAKRRTCEGSGSGAGLLTQAVVKWQGEDEPTAVLLHPEFYGELKKEEGGVVLDEQDTEEGNAEVVLDILDELDIKANEAASFYCPKS